MNWLMGTQIPYIKISTKYCFVSVEMLFLLATFGSLFQSLDVLPRNFIVI